MKQLARAYRLSFVPSRKKEAPELMLRVPVHTANEVEASLARRTILTRADIIEYLGYETTTTWSQQWLPFDKRRWLGVRHSFYALERGEEIEYHFPLRLATLHETALSFSVALSGLASALHSEGRIGPPQHYTLETLCSTRDANAHASGGDIYPAFRRWLARLGTHPARESALAHVRHAMRDAWHSLAWERAQRHADQCEIALTDDGRFMLSCLGNACDLSLYYDGDAGPTADRPSRFSYHNLDGAAQQLTLVAGFARLCELAEGELK